MDDLQGMSAPTREIGGYWFRPCAMAFAVAMALGLSACGGGGGGNVRPTSPPPPPAGGSTFSGGEIDVDANSVTVLPDNLGGSINLIKGGAGTLTLTGTDSYTGGTTITLGTLQIGNGGTTGSLGGNVTDNGVLAFDRSDSITFGGIVSGSGSLKQIGAGTLILSGANTYTGGTTISSGILQLGSGGTTGSVVGSIVDNGTLIFNRSDDLSFANAITGSGGLIKSGINALTLTGNNTYTGSTQVQSGSLFVDGDQSGAKGLVTVASGTTFGGNGIIGGDVSIADGATLAPGSKGAIGTLTIKGNLDLSSGSVLSYDFAPSTSPSGQVSDLINVHGNLTLDGALALNMAIGDTLGPGVYRLINYDGTLTDNGLTAQNGWQIETGIAHQVNLIGAQGASLSFWDGDAGPANNHLIDGGSGTWQNGSASSNSNWTDAAGASNGTYTGGTFAVFQGAPGTVTVDASHGDIDAVGMQFIGNGYVLQGDTIHLVAGSEDPSSSFIRVGDGTIAGAADTATINNVLDGSTALVKSDAGTLVLGGNNTYTGGTAIYGGTLQVGQGGTAGLILGDVNDDGSLVFDRSDVVSFDGFISGIGSLTQAGSGTLILTGSNNYTGNTIISRGVLQVGNGGITGAISGPVLDNGSLVFDRSNYVYFLDVISGSGSLKQSGTGDLELGGANTYTGGTTIDSGTLTIGSGLQNAAIVGNVTDNGTLVFNTGSAMNFDGLVSGSGVFKKYGQNTLTLTGANTFSGGTEVDGGTLELAPGAILGTGPIAVHWSNGNDVGVAVLQVDAGVTLTNQILVSGAGTVANAGTLGGNLNVAVGGDGGYLTSVNNGGGRITGIQSAVAFTGLGTVNNSDGGVLSGDGIAIAIGGSGLVANDGPGSLIRSTHGMAVQILGDLAMVNNIAGATIISNLTPVYLEHGGSVTNEVGSTIDATGATDGDCGSTGICSIYVASGASTPYTPDGGLTLTNGGTIIGNVQLIPAAHNVVTLRASGSIHGDLFIGTNGSSLLELTGDIGTSQLYSHAVTGTTTFDGQLRKTGAGSWTIDSNDLSLVKDVEIDGGTLQIGNGGTTGSIGSGLTYFLQVFNGTVVFDHSDDITYQGSIQGADQVGNQSLLVQAGTGKLTLTNTNFISLQILRGTVQVGDGGIGGFIGGPVQNNGSLIFDHSVEEDIGGISGTGSVTVEGGGTLFLNGANTYTGGTLVSNGTLRSQYVMPGNVQVDTAGAMQGWAPSGPMPGTPGTAGNLANAGRVEVGGGNANIGGNYTQASTGTLAVSLGSKLAVTGTATLNGGTLEITGADTGYVSNAHTNVLTATGGLSGTFTSLVKDTGVVFTATTINYDANNVWLDTTGLNITNAIVSNGGTFTPASFGSAQRVQSAFTQLDSKIAAGSIASVSKDFVQAAGQFQQAPTVQAAQASLQSLSGQLHAASAAMTFEAIDASSRALSDRFDDLLGKNVNYGMWTHSLSMDGDMSRSGYDGVGFQLNGWLVGEDRQIGRNGVAGFAFGQSQGRQQLDQSYDRNHNRSTEGMFYAGWLNGNWYAQGRVGFGYFQQDVNRQVLLGYSAQGVSTDYNGNYNVAYGESGLHLNWGGTRLMPFVDMQYATIARDGFAEQGAGGFGLRSGAQNLDRLQAGVGMRANHHWDLGDHRALDFNASAQWQRTLASHGDVFDASFVGMQQWQPLEGIGLSRYSGVLDVGLDATLSKSTALKFGYEYETGQRDEAQTLSARVIVAF